MAMPPLEGEAIPEFDFNDATAGKGTVTELFGRQIREGGVDGTTRFDALSRVIGYWIRRCREGHVEAAQAWAEIVAYNEARIDPPWPPWVPRAGRSSKAGCHRPRSVPPTSSCSNRSGSVDSEPGPDP